MTRTDNYFETTNTFPDGDEYFFPCEFQGRSGNNGRKRVDKISFLLSLLTFSSAAGLWSLSDIAVLLVVEAVLAAIANAHSHPMMMMTPEDDAAVAGAAVQYM